jgi:hypothetical protein
MLKQILHMLFVTLQTTLNLKHDITTVTTTKIGLSAGDDKRIIFDGKTNTIAHGHYRTKDFMWDQYSTLRTACVAPCKHSKHSATIIMTHLGLGYLGRSRPEILGIFG